MPIFDLANILKESARSAIKSTNPTEGYIGKVLSIHPLQISIGEGITLGKEQLFLTRHVCDFSAALTVNHRVERDSCPSCSGDHAHTYTGEKEFFFHHGLEVGEEVFLLRLQGGQAFVVMDRIFPTG